MLSDVLATSFGGVRAFKIGTHSARKSAPPSKPCRSRSSASCARRPTLCRCVPRAWTGWPCGRQDRRIGAGRCPAGMVSTVRPKAPLRGSLPHAGGKRAPHMPTGARLYAPPPPAGDAVWAGGHPHRWFQKGQEFIQSKRRGVSTRSQAPSAIGHGLTVGLASRRKTRCQNNTALYVW